MAEVGKKTGKKTQAGRDVYETPEGEMVSEKSTTFKYKGKWINVPTIFRGHSYDEETLMLMLDQGLIKPTSIHDNLEEAVSAAQERTDSLEFNKGGTPMYKQMELFEDGGLRDEGGMVDEESGNEVPAGSTRKEVRDDIPAMLSEGEFVFPADVVRYIGLENLMRIRQEAKMGLKQMEAMGQMGNSDEATLPDDMPFSMMDLIIVEGKEEEEPEEKAHGGVIHAANGTFVTPMFDPSNQDVREYKNEAGDSLFIPFLGGEPVYPIPAGYFPAGQAPTKTETEQAIPTGGDDDQSPTPTPEGYDWNTDTSATDGKALGEWIKQAERQSTFGNVAAGIAMGINPLIGGAIALANKNQKKQIVEMLDEKIAQARKTPVQGQVAALQDLKKRLTTKEGQTILGKVVSSILDPITDALGLSEEEKKKSKASAVVNASQDPKESDEETKKKQEQADKNPDAVIASTETPPETTEAPTTEAPTTEAPVAPETPEAIPTAPETPTIATEPDITGFRGQTDLVGMRPTDTATPDITAKEGATPSTLPLRTEQAVVGAGMTVLQNAVDQLRQSTQSPTSAPTLGGKIVGMGMQAAQDEESFFNRIVKGVSDFVSGTDKSPAPSVDRTPSTTPTPRGGGDDSGPNLAQQMQEQMKEKAKKSLDKFDESVEKVKAAAVKGSDQRSIDVEAARVKEKLEQQSKGIKTGFKKGGLASRKK